MTPESALDLVQSVLAGLTSVPDAVSNAVSDPIPVLDALWLEMTCSSEISPVLRQFLDLLLEQTPAEVAVRLLDTELAFPGEAEIFRRKKTQIRTKSFFNVSVHFLFRECPEGYAKLLADLVGGGQFPYTTVGFFGLSPLRVACLVLDVLANFPDSPLLGLVPRSLPLLEAARFLLSSRAEQGAEFFRIIGRLCDFDEVVQLVRENFNELFSHVDVLSLSPGLAVIQGQVESLRTSGELRRVLEVARGPSSRGTLGKYPGIREALEQVIVKLWPVIPAEVFEALGDYGSSQFVVVLIDLLAESESQTFSHDTKYAGETKCAAEVKCAAIEYIIKWSSIHVNANISERVWSLVSQSSVAERWEWYARLEAKKERLNAARGALRRVVKDDKGNMKTVIGFLRTGAYGLLQMLGSVVVGFNSNLIGPYIEITKRLTKLEVDISVFFIARYLVELTKKEAVSEQGVVEQWVSNLGEFVGRFFAVHPDNADSLAGVLKVVLSEKNFRMMMHGIIKYCGQVEVLEELNEEQITALAGGEKLRIQSLQSSMTGPGKGRACLKEALQADDLLGDMLNEVLDDRFSLAQDDGGDHKLNGTLLTHSHKLMLQIFQFAEFAGIATTRNIIADVPAYHRLKRMLRREQGSGDGRWENLEDMFWRLSLQDVQFPMQAYERELEKLRAVAGVAGKGENARKAKKDKAKIEKLRAEIAAEMDMQKLHVAEIIDKFDEFELADGEVDVANFCETCVYPRAIFSFEDAVYCAVIVKKLVDRKFLDVDAVLERVTGSLLDSTLATCCEFEARCFGIFLNTLLREVPLSATADSALATRVGSGLRAEGHWGERRNALVVLSLILNSTCVSGKTEAESLSKALQDLSEDEEFKNLKILAVGLLKKLNAKIDLIRPPPPPPPPPAQDSESADRKKQIEPVSPPSPIEAEEPPAKKAKVSTPPPASRDAGRSNYRGSQYYGDAGASSSSRRGSDRRRR